MKKLLSLLLMVLMLLGGAAFAEENEEDTTPVVAPIVTFKSGFYVGYLDREIKITVSCKNKSSATVPEKYLELRNHRGEVLERAFWRNPRYDLTFSVYVTEDMHFNPRSPHGERPRKVTILSIRIIGFAQKVYHKTVLLRISLAENAVILPEKPRNPVRTSLQKAGGLRFARAIRAARPYSISSPSGA